jgi:hypothetical protein
MKAAKRARSSWRGGAAASHQLKADAGKEGKAPKGQALAAAMAREVQRLTAPLERDDDGERKVAEAWKPPPKRRQLEHTRRPFADAAAICDGALHIGLVLGGHRAASTPLALETNALRAKRAVAPGDMDPLIDETVEQQLVKVGAANTTVIDRHVPCSIDSMLWARIQFCAHHRCHCRRRGDPQLTWRLGRTKVVL